MSSVSYLQGHKRKKQSRGRTPLSYREKCGEASVYKPWSSYSSWKKKSEITKGKNSPPKNPPPLREISLGVQGSFHCSSLKFLASSGGGRSLQSVVSDYNKSSRDSQRRKSEVARLKKEDGAGGRSNEKGKGG